MRGGVRVLSIELTRRGFAFAVLESSENLIEWGGRRVTGDLSHFLAKVETLVGVYRPDVLVVEEPAGSRRNSRGQERLAWMEQYAADHGIRHRAVSRQDLANGFPDSDGRRHPVAIRVSRLFPELAQRLPPPRRPWHSEAPAMGVFIAVARGHAALRNPELPRWH